MEKTVLQRYLIVIGIIILVGIIVSLWVIPAVTIGGFMEFRDLLLPPFSQLSAALSDEYKESYTTWVKLFWIVYVLVVLGIWYSSRNKREYDEIEHGSSDWAKGGEQYSKKDINRTKLKISCTCI